MEDSIEILKELYKRNSQIKLHRDTFYINGLGFLSTIRTSVQYRTSIYLEDNKAKTLYKRTQQDTVNL